MISRMALVLGLLVLIPPAMADVVEVQVQAAQPAPDVIFVPKPKDEGETLDENARTKDKAVGDVVTTIRGDKVVGRVVAIEGGKLRLTAPHFVGEVVVEASALDRIQFTPTEEFRGADVVALSNGDSIAGQIVAITPEAVVIESEPTGPLRISRKIVTELAFSRRLGVSIESHFAQGRMEPWTAVGPGWTLADGVLQCTNYGGQSCLVAPFEQDGPTTMVVDVQGISGRYINCELVLCADRNSVIARFYSSYFYLMYCRNGGTNSLTNRHIGRSTRSGTLRFAYDPKTGKARAWLNTMDLGEYAVPNHVMKGIVPPSTTPARDKTIKAHVVHFVNNDRVAADEVTMADGKLQMKSALGDLSCPTERVASIVFRPDAVEKPRRRKGDVWVETTAGRLTMQFERLSPEFLFGKSSHFGQVKVRRNALKGLRFNIYK